MRKSSLRKIIGNTRRDGTQRHNFAHGKWQKCHRRGKQSLAVFTVCNVFRNVYYCKQGHSRLKRDGAGRPNQRKAGGNGRRKYYCSCSGKRKHYAARNCRKAGLLHGIHGQLRGIGQAVNITGSLFIVAHHAGGNCKKMIL